MVAPADQSHGKTALMKALLHLKNDKNDTVELLIGISETMGDIKEFVNAAYTNSYYKGKSVGSTTAEGIQWSNII